MPHPEALSPRRPALRWFVPCVAVALLGLAGCDATFPKLGGKASATVPAVSDAESSRLVLGWLESLRLAGPAGQAELVAAARQAYEQQGSLDGQLRYGLALAMPGIPGAEPQLARRHLGEVLARGERLQPGPRALAQLALAEVDARLTLQSDNLRLQTEGALRDRERTTALTRRLQQELDENNRLRRALDEAQKKLEAVLLLERGGTPVLAPAATAPGAPQATNQTTPQGPPQATPQAIPPPRPGKRP